MAYMACPGRIHWLKSRGGDVLPRFHEHAITLTVSVGELCVGSVV